jgi:sulfate transport system ATP-binding protein
MQVSVEHISKAFGEYPALDDVSLTIPSGELVALLGPSGSGKTTLLRVIAGIDTPDAGRVRFAGTDVTDRPIREREIGFVFQDYALFDHMTVGDNVAFGLSVRGAPKREIAARVRELLSLVQLDGLAGRLPRQLSGGQRQRVALARALAPRPRLLLLDEPFGALDARVRTELRSWLRKLHDELHVTSVFVTHDQEEALEVADRVVVMNLGRVLQVGSPTEVFDEPATAFVMEFLGGVNVLSNADGTKSYVRSHDLLLGREAGDGPSLSATVTHIRRVGVVARVLLSTDHGELLAEVPHRELAELGVERGARLVAHVRSARNFPE